jgi:hypothetical protein
MSASSTVPTRILQLERGLAIVLVLFVIAALLGILPPFLQSNNALAKDWCSQHGYTQAANYGYDRNHTLVVICQNISYEPNNKNMTVTTDKFYLKSWTNYSMTNIARFNK